MDPPSLTFFFMLTNVAAEGVFTHKLRTTHSTLEVGLKLRLLGQCHGGAAPARWCICRPRWADRRVCV
jgi:hypothetical protein